MGALVRSCHEMSLVEGSPSLGSLGRSCRERSPVEGGPSWGALDRSCREMSLVEGSFSLGWLGRSCREGSLLSELLDVGFVAHPGEVLGELLERPGEGRGASLLPSPRAREGGLSPSVFGLSRNLGNGSRTLPLENGCVRPDTRTSHQTLRVENEGVIKLLGDVYLVLVTRC